MKKQTRNVKILHLVNDYNHTKVHRNLVKTLDEMGYKQLVYIPLKIQLHKGNNEFPFLNKESCFIYSPVQSKYYKFFFRRKINFLLKYLDTHIATLPRVDILHASTMYSDGCLAYELFKKYEIPYIVTVRNTDLFTYYKFRKDLLPLARRILKNASKVVFISEANYRYFQSLKPLSKGLNLGKVIVINNGIDDYWISNRRLYQYESKVNFNGIYVGRFDDNKNVEQLMRCVSIFNSKSQKKIRLSLVGGYGRQRSKILQLIEKERDVEYLGETHDKEVLKTIYRNCDFFAMVSKKETFGLVYLEALSQGLPVLYTEGQGIDGMTQLTIGESSELKDKAIYLALEKITKKNYSDINKLDLSKFSWTDVAEQYCSIYKELL